VKAARATPIATTTCCGLTRRRFTPRNLPDGNFW